MRRLYFRIYLAVLGSLVIFAVLLGAAAWVFRELREPDRAEPQVPFISDVANHLLPIGASLAVLNEELKFWHLRTRFDLALLSPNGEVLAQAGSFPEGAFATFTNAGSKNIRWRRPHGIFAVRLNDGRQLVLARPPSNVPPPLRWLGIIFAIGFAVAVCAYPLVRRLTRTLEEFQQGVAAFGEGNLNTRVAIRGRDDIGKLAETFNAAAERIEALVSAHKSLLANVSHEIRSPLARLRMAAEVTGPSIAKQDRDEIVRNIAELDRLVEEILLASRLDADAGGTIKREDIDLAGLLAEECAPYDAELTVIPGETVIVQGDANLLHRLFRNLLDNARRHGGQGAIRVQIRSSDRSAIVTVCDEGPGIIESERGRIFEPFYRSNRETEEPGGFGLGLTLVRQISEKHNGWVQYLPQEPKGSCFQVSLPLSRGEF